VFVDFRAPAGDGTGRLFDGQPGVPFVTVASNELGVPSSSLLEVVQRSIGRDEFFAGLYILACLNGLSGRFVLALGSEGWVAAILAINVFVLFACYAGISAILSEKREPVRSVDLAVGVIFLVLVALPVFALSWVAVVLLSGYILCFANSPDRRRGALILLALTVPMLWGRVLFQFFAKPILEADAILLRRSLGRTGLVIWFDSGMIQATCS